jgi:hypothetical protein
MIGKVPIIRAGHVMVAAPHPYRSALLSFDISFTGGASGNTAGLNLAASVRTSAQNVGQVLWDHSRPDAAKFTRVTTGESQWTSLWPFHQAQKQRDRPRRRRSTFGILKCADISGLHVLSRWCKF